ncbi:uncharacterized protein STAUR_2368 [Stigmatella aurantiaca DW4/3-1]|uniref:Uncharacterized protein n=1 Tax=Stigmatella aurantiaca (strain DW4/3-1) TaxID=378806 RepID=E3FEZ1_STIAD|nr:uncharacterized protein STAUR_2368 [Stigmatella aurantiaca DW4/3-1]
MGRGGANSLPTGRCANARLPSAPVGVKRFTYGDATLRFEQFPRMDMLVEVEGPPETIEHAIRATGIPRECFTADRLATFIHRFEARTGGCAARLPSETTSCNTSLERLTKVRIKGPEEDQAAAQNKEAEVDIIAPFIAHAQTPLPVKPRVGPLHHPPVLSQPLLRLDAGPCDAWSDAAPTQAATVLARRVRLVGMQLVGPVTGRTARLPHLGHGLQQREQLARVMDVGSRQTLGQRKPSSVDKKMMFAARLRSVRRVLAREGPPLEARTVEESIEARLKSTWPRWPSSLSSSRWSCSNTPARVHCSRRRQAVIPDRPNCLVGSISQGMPVLSTKTMASKAARSSTRGRPGFFFFLGAGSSGTTRSHSASGTRSRTMKPKCSWAWLPSTLPFKPYFC